MHTLNCAHLKCGPPWYGRCCDVGSCHNSMTSHFCLPGHAAGDSRSGRTGERVIGRRPGRACASPGAEGVPGKHASCTRNDGGSRSGGCSPENGQVRLLRGVDWAVWAVWCSCGCVWFVLCWRDTPREGPPSRNSPADKPTSGGLEIVFNQQKSRLGLTSLTATLPQAQRWDFGELLCRVCKNVDRGRRYLWVALWSGVLEHLLSVSGGRPALFY